VDCKEVTQWIQDIDRIAVSDGLFKNPMGTSSWRILNKHQETIIGTGANFVARKLEDQSSYRSEVAGMCSTIIFVALTMR
jgi:hypothetical protein